MKDIFRTVIFSLLTIFITISLIKFPDQSLEASIRGLNIWWEVVFPSLLPFFILAELFISFGIARFIGVLFEPIMRPLFNVPGVGSFAWIMGMASGYPSGAKISVRLREEKQITKVEAERLVSFTNAASPLFIFGAIAVGFFFDVQLGMLIAVSHYLSNTLVGICMRFYGQSRPISNKAPRSDKRMLKRAFNAMHQTRTSDSRPFGEIIGDAVLSSITTLVIIGGFITLFSVFTKLLFIIGITSIIGAILQYILHFFLLPTELSIPLISGLFEISLGTQLVAQTNVDSLLAKIIVVSFILGFNGFSIQAQVSSIIAKSDISFVPYFFARLLHGIFASVLTVILFKPIYLNRKTISIEDLPVFSKLTNHNWLEIFQLLKQIGPLITMSCLIITIIILFRRIKIK